MEVDVKLIKILVFISDFVDSVDFNVIKIFEIVVKFFRLLRRMINILVLFLMFFYSLVRVFLKKVLGDIIFWFFLLCLILNFVFICY